MLNLGYNLKVFSYLHLYYIIIKAKYNFNNNIYKEYLPIIKLIFIKYL